MKYVGGVTQLSINSNGRHSGIMGRREVGTITANDSSQTITTALEFPAINQLCDISLIMVSAGRTVAFEALYVASQAAGSNVIEVARPTSVGMVAIPTPLTISAQNKFRFTFTTNADLTYIITFIGKGTY